MSIESRGGDTPATAAMSIMADLYAIARLSAGNKAAYQDDFTQPALNEDLYSNPPRERISEPVPHP
jgi:hypothetical protein